MQGRWRYQGSRKTIVYLSGVIDIKRRPFEILGKGIWTLLEHFGRLRGFDGAIALGRLLA
jgi:hypothetical protein